MMTVDLSNKMETSDYYHTSLSSPAIAAGLCQIDQNRPIATMSLLEGISASSSSSYPSNNQQGKESIHSGQFMVSHFEAEAQDEDDTEIKMPDPDDPNYEKPDDLNLCTEIQLYVPQNINQPGGSSTIITSHLEIETSLTKLFKCMNLAYRQKLTSPKWNHFKGVRLRWKDKIRLNNLIWRCWHMQFILKKKTPVCQFASPLDVDIHSNPQSVVLEGKYWKRQLSVIKAEYRKWRRNSKTKAIGCCFDTRSEFDFLDWSPLSNDRNLMITEDWTSDTLFSAINVPFPFPDPREIARGAGIADFIQPSLGPLQPNLEDIDITFQELLQNTRLPPVPEEGTEDILKNVDYNFPAIMGSEQLGSVNIMDVQTTNTSQSQQNIVVDSSTIEDTTMVDINTTLNSLQQYTTNKICSNNMNTMQSSTSTSNILGAATATNMDNIMGYSENIMNDTSNSNDATTATLNSFQMLANVNQLIDLQSGGMSATSSLPSSSSQLNSTNSGKNNVLKGRVSKAFSKSFRKREPHNYDKAQPTLHQTNIYQQMLAEQKHQQTQQQQQQCQLPIVLSSNLQFTNQHPYQSQNTISTNTAVNSDTFSIQTPNNSNSSNNSNSGSINNLNILSTMKSYSVPQTTIHQNTATQLISHHHKPLSASSEILSILNINDNTNAVQDLYKATMHGNNTATTSYKTFTNAQNMKKLTSSLSSSSINYINMLSNGSAANNSSGMSIKQLSPTSGMIDPSNNQQQDIPTKEMYRSNSLPLNSSLQKFEMMNKDEMFVMPKFHAKSNHHRSRTRSTSTHQPVSVPPSSSFPVTAVALQTATSEPLLNSTLAQLLTTNSTSSNKSVKQSSAPATLTQNVIRMPTFATGATAIAYQQQQQNQGTQSQQQLTVNQLSLSPTRSTSLPQSANLHSPPTTTKMMSFPPCLSPDSFTDDSPLSPTKTGTTLNNLKYMKDSQRRVGHIQAEQKRRYNIKNGFDMLHSLIPQLQQNPNAKLSKAAMLQKGAEYIKQLRIERNIINEKMDVLKKERDNLNASLSHLHSVLPANGAPVSRQRTERVKQLFSQYVRYRTMQNWKFWILGLILEPLLNSYTTSVSMASMEELYRTALLWVEQHCSLVELRPAVSNKLRYLSMTTDILSDPPSTLQEEVLKSINNTEGQHPNLNGT